MRVYRVPPAVIAIALAALAAASASGAQSVAERDSVQRTDQTMAREAALWGAAKDHRMGDFRAMLAPGYIAVYGSGRADADRDVTGTGGMSITDVKFDSVSVRALDAKTIVDSYLVYLSAHAGPRDISGPYWSTSTWHRDETGVWRLALHTETRAPATTH